MKKTNNNQEDIKKKIQELRTTLNRVYIKYGNTKDVVEISQELDKYILIEQKKNLESAQKNNGK